MKNLVLTMCSVSSLALMTPAYAQATDAQEGESASTTDTIIVTARRREESVQDIPLTVNTVGSEDIGKLNLQEFTEVQALVPGLLLSNNDNGIGANAQIRGIHFDINASVDPTVEFYLNDAPVPAGIVLRQMFDIAQVEVLRGPQGTLRGRSSPSGSITVTTRKPDLYEIGGSASISVNDIGNRNINAAFGIPIIEGIAGIRVAGVYDEGEVNRVKSINNIEEPSSEEWSGRVTMLVTPADWLRLEGSYQRTERDAAFYLPYASASLFDPTADESPMLIRPKDRLSISETLDTNDQVFENYNWRAEVRFAGQALIYQGSRTLQDLKAVSNLDTANFAQGADATQRTRTDGKSTSHELRLQNEERVLGMFDYAIGYFHQKGGANTRLVRQDALILPTLFGGGFAAFNETDIIPGTPFTTEESFFGNLTAHIGDSTEISGGLRHIQIKEPASNLTLDFGSGPVVLPASDAVNDKKLIYTASIKHNFTPDLMVYASTGTSRRPGPTIVGNFSPRQSPLQRQFTEIPSENSTSYEVGLKSAWLDGRLVFNLTGYYQKFTNYPFKLSSPVYFTSFSFDRTTFQFIPTVGSSAQFAAAVPVKVKGLEAELAYKASDNFNFNVVASYADGKIKNGLIPCDDLNGDGVPDVLTSAPTVADLDAAYGDDYIGSCRVSQRSSFQSPFNATAQAEYTRPISDSMDMFTRGQFTYFGHSRNDPTNAFDNVGSYGLLNLFAGVRDPDGMWELNLFAKNVFDTTRSLSYSPGVTSYQRLIWGGTFTNGRPDFVGASGESYTSPYSRIRTTAPRQFGVNVRFAFGSR